MEYEALPLGEIMAWIQAHNELETDLKQTR